MLGDDASDDIHRRPCGEWGDDGYRARRISLGADVVERPHEAKSDQQQGRNRRKLSSWSPREARRRSDSDRLPSNA